MKQPEYILTGKDNVNILTAAQLALLSNYGYDDPLEEDNDQVKAELEAGLEMDNDDPESSPLGTIT